MGEFSLMHWLIVAVIVLFIFGAKRIPEVGASLGKGIREFKRSMSGIGEAPEEEKPALAPPEDGVRSLKTQTTANRDPKRLSE